jgi:predicted TIM-barrel fold metal-dependent hydrolase
MTNRHDPEGRRLPVKLDTTTNGEFSPIPLSPANVAANRLARERAGHNARRLGMKRRDFLITSCGAATTLLAFNAANAAAGKTGGRFALAAEAGLDPAAAAQSLQGREFIFDVQGHFVSPDGAWLAKAAKDARPFSQMPKAGCALGEKPGERSYLQCLGPQEFIKDIFLDSDTDMMVLSFVPSRTDAEPVTIQEADAVRRIVDELEGTHRLLLHGRVNPNQPGDIDRMEELAKRWGVSAWKTYTQWGPDGKGYFLSDEATGVPFIEKARAIGVKVICVHKGIPFGRQSYEHSQCSDIGVVAKRYPDVDFIIYHSGYVPGNAELPYDAAAKRDGIDTLIRSLVENEVPPNSNVYAELGSTWRMLMREPDSAAHALGKLFKYVGERNVLWGTDSIWYGSPQDQIQAFRIFQISDDFQEKYGYPAITPALRAQVFGLNATRPYRVGVDEVLKRARADDVSRRRAEYRERPDPSYLTYGPKTRREFLALLRARGGPV